MSSNPFALLNDDSDDDDEVKVPKVAPAPKKTADAPAKPSQSAAPASKQQAQKKENASAPEKSKANGQSRPKENTPKNDTAPETDASEKQTKRGGNGGKDGKDGKHRKGPAGPAPDRPPKHESDRKSGQKTDGRLRKGGRGPRGMGSVAADAEDATKGKDILEGAIDEVEGAEGEDGASPEESGSRRKRDSAPAPEPVPEEPPKMTYEEYLQSKSKTPVVLSNPELFKPVEVKATETDLSGLSIKDSEDLGDFLVLGGIKVSKSKGKEQRSTVKSQGVKLVDGFQNAALVAPPREDNDRGGRGDRGERGGRDGGRGGDRNRRSSGGQGGKTKGGVAIDLGNNDLFPTLGSK